MGMWRGRMAGLRPLLMLVLAAAALAPWTGAAGHEIEPTDALPPSIEGRFSVVSDAGGAVWAFQPGGQLILVGPGDLVATGLWHPAAALGAFDASVGIGVTGQELTVLGALSPDGSRVALHVRAGDPRTPGNGVPWPRESRLTGERIGLTGPGPSPATSADECLRPAWETGSVVDWDPCEPGATATAKPSIEVEA